MIKGSIHQEDIIILNVWKPVSPVMLLPIIFKSIFPGSFLHSTVIQRKVAATPGFHQPPHPPNSRFNAGLRLHISFCVKHYVFGRCCAQDWGEKAHRDQLLPQGPCTSPAHGVPPAFSPRAGHDSSILPRLDIWPYSSDCSGPNSNAVFCRQCPDP